jgi:C4-dicarboxylate-specific signal transduction histidine kinase
MRQAGATFSQIRGGGTLNQSKMSWQGSKLILNQLMEIARISALAEMASGVAHELNQPLGAIATFAQAGERMLNRPDPLVTGASDVFRQINQEALSAGEGIRRIRRLFDQEESTRTRCQMSEVIEELLPVLEMLASGFRGTLQFQAAPDLPPVFIDRLRIQHVVFALVQNAFDATAGSSEPPSVKITVTGDRYAVETSVADSGSGISPEVQNQLFRPFFTTKARGTGLGLASSRAIIEAHEGKIAFESSPSGGSRFTFRLPSAGI